MTLRVISGNPRETDAYAAARGISDFEHVSTTEQLRTAPKGSRVVVTGNHFKNPVVNNMGQFALNYVAEPLEAAPTPAPVPTPQQVQEHRRAEAKKRLEVDIEEVGKTFDAVAEPIRTPEPPPEEAQLDPRVPPHVRIEMAVRQVFEKHTAGLNIQYPEARRLVYLEHELITQLIQESTR